MSVHRLPVRNPERDTVCRDCDRDLGTLVALADHYMNRCVGGFVNPRRGGTVQRRSNRYETGRVYTIGRHR